MPFMLTIDEKKVFGDKKFVNAKGNTECVEFVRQATGAPQTSIWKPGKRVVDCLPGTIKRGTAIATFVDEKYAVIDHLGQHAAIYLWHNANCVQVLDQWNGKGKVTERPIHVERPPATKRINVAGAYFIIE